MLFGLLSVINGGAGAVPFQLQTPESFAVVPYPTEAPTRLRVSWNDPNETFSQNLKIVVIGSSSAKGEGASDLAHSWVKLVEAALPAYSGNFTVINIAQGGYGSYHFRETGFVPPEGYPAPDPDHNVTKAMTYDPDIVIFANAGNDIVTGGYDINTEIIPNYIAIRDIVEAGGAIFIPTTTQPRTGTNIVRRTNLETLGNWVKANFPVYINFFDNLVWRTPENISTHLTALEDYRFDTTHFNNAGHNVMFEQAMLILSAIIEDTYKVASYVLQRSTTSGSGFTTLTTLTSFQAHYDDTTALVNTTYYYRVKALGLTGFIDSSYTSEASSVIPGIQLLQTMYLNFGGTSASPLYNNITTANNTTPLALINDTGAASGISIKGSSFSQITSGDWPWSGTSFAFPDDVMKTAFNNQVSRNLTITGRAGKKYKLVLIGSRSNSGGAAAPRVTSWVHGSEAPSLECFQNKTQWVTLGGTEHMALDGSNNIVIAVTPGAGVQAYTNCGILYEYGTP